jgi:hypothetical protein
MLKTWLRNWLTSAESGKWKSGQNKKDLHQTLMNITAFRTEGVMKQTHAHDNTCVCLQARMMKPTPQMVHAPKPSQHVHPNGSVGERRRCRYHQKMFSSVELEFVVDHPFQWAEGLSNDKIALMYISQSNVVINAFSKDEAS